MKTMHSDILRNMENERHYCKTKISMLESRLELLDAEIAKLRDEQLRKDNGMEPVK